MKTAVPVLILLVFLVACATSSSPLPTADQFKIFPTFLPSPTPTSAATAAVMLPTQTATPVSCQLAPIVRPTKPSVVPPSTQLDETTGLHMTGIPVDLDLESYRLVVSGLVDHQLSLTLDELRCLPKITTAATLNCIGVFTDSATWAGTPIAEVLALAGARPEMKSIVLVGADGYSPEISRDQAFDRANFLAYEQQGRPLPVLHGFPLRAVFPNLPGGFWVKWLIEIKVK